MELPIVANSSTKLFNLLLRIAALVSTLTAAIIMATSHETVSFFTIQFEAKYSDVPSFKYFVANNILAGLYSFGALFIPQEGLVGKVLIALDVVFTMLLTSSLSASLAIAEVGKRGNSRAGWLPICKQVPNYCERSGGALAAGFISVFIFMLTMVFSAYSTLIIINHDRPLAHKISEKTDAITDK
uniref:CASP-like protein n=1 Tax=Kalanchoe fedtschenkoi TaxID=63787 RepID=A0A7N0TJN1_KALFE